MILIMQHVDKVKIKQYHKNQRTSSAQRCSLKTVLACETDLVLAPCVCWAAAGLCRQPAVAVCHPDWPPQPDWSPLQTGGALHPATHQRHPARRPWTPSVSDAQHTHRGEDSDNIVTGPLLILVRMPLYIYTNEDTCSNDSSSYFFQLKHHSWVSTEDHLSWYKLLSCTAAMVGHHSQWCELHGFNETKHKLTT